MFAFSNVLHFFAHKLARLSGGRFAFTFVLARAFNWFFFWHNKNDFAFNSAFGCNKLRLVLESRNRQSAFARTFRAHLRIADAKEFGVAQNKRLTFASWSDF